MISRLERMVGAMRKFYGILPSPPAEPFMLFVWDVLASRTTPRKRDAAIAALRRIPALTPDSMWRAPQGKLEGCVKVAGPYVEQRLQALRTGVEVFRRRPGLSAAIRGPLLSATRAVSPLPRLGEGGAHRMLLFASDHAVLPMDAGLLRVGARLGYGAGKGSHRREARAVRLAMTAELSPTVEAYRHAATYLLHHAVATCTERDPHCGACPLLDDCRYPRR